MVELKTYSTQPQEIMQDETTEINSRVENLTKIKREKCPYPHDTTAALSRLIERYTRTKRAIPVSFRKLVPWLKVGERATHYIHPYPAKLLPHIAHFFLSSELICPNKGTVLDPFGGSGTVALEACLSGRTAGYVDTNPLAKLIASVKLWSPKDTNFDEVLLNVYNRFRRCRTLKHPNVVNIKKWFDPPVIRGLTRLRVAIEAEPDINVREFLQVAFSATVRRVSNADLRLSVPVISKDRRSTNVSPTTVWERFKDQFESNVRRSNELSQLSYDYLNWNVVGADARSIAKDTGGLLENNSVDLVITSPPYAGAQKYIRASSLSLGWLGIAGQGELKPLENRTIGREHLSKEEIANAIITSVDKANRVIKKIHKKNPTRAAICATYLNEMEQVFEQVARVTKPGGHFILVIGNNEVCGEKFLSSDYLSEQILSLGFNLRIKMVDEIKSRGLMTKRNKTAGMITREWILVFQKEMTKL